MLNIFAMSRMRSTNRGPRRLLVPPLLASHFLLSAVLHRRNDIFVLAVRSLHLIWIHSTNLNGIPSPSHVRALGPCDCRKQMDGRLCVCAVWLSCRGHIRVFVRKQLGQTKSAGRAVKLSEHEKETHSFSCDL